MSQYKVKGTHLFQARKWIEERLGEGSFAKLAKQATDEDWPGNILAGSWYDVEPLNSILATASTRTGRSVEVISTEIAVMNARNDLTSVYRAFLRVAGPHMTLAATKQLWANYVAFGQAKALKNEPGIYVGECRGIPRHLLSWASGCWNGFIPTAIEVSGGKDCVGEISSRQREEEGNLWMLQYSAKYR